MNLQVMIKLEDVTKVYRMGKVEVPALRGVSLSISEGEMVAIIGASGSGKSTLLNIIGCLDRPTSGRYLLDGTNVGQLNDNQLAELRNRKFGFVFQDFNLLPRATALSNVELPLIYRGGVRQRRERAAMALEIVGLGKRANHKPTELSGGEQQRVAIARALVKNPEIVVADEPTGNLDYVTGQKIADLMKKLNQRFGGTYIVVSHDLSITEKADRVFHLRDGKIASIEAQPLIHASKKVHND